MHTIILEEPGRFAIEDTREPEPPEAGDAIVAIRRVGICGTDLHAFRGEQPFFSYPRILGHELGVEVLEVGRNERGIRVGDRCAVEPYLHCGRCFACRRGRTNCCGRLRVLGVHTDGGMRERIKIPVTKLHRSETLSFDELALVETLGIGAHAVARARIEAGESALIIGAGPIGLSVVQFATLAGARVIVADLSESRRRFAGEHFAIDAAISGGEGIVDRLREANGGELPSVVFDATGSRPSMEASFELVASTGKLVVVGLVQGRLAFDDPEFHRRELTLLATRNSLASDFERILKALEDGSVRTSAWITHRADRDSLVGEFPGWIDPSAGVVKAVLQYS